MLLNSNILIYGANGENPKLDEILDRTDLSAASVTRIETVGYHRLSETERVWLEATFARLKILPLDDAVSARAIALRQQRKMGLADAIIAATALEHN
jgi:predicted nucleic acid-binding protein